MMHDLQRSLQISVYAVWTMSRRVLSVSLVTSFPLGGLSDDSDRSDLVFFLRKLVRASVGMPWTSRVTEGFRLCGNLYFALSLSEMDLKAISDFGQLQMCWSVSMSSKHLGHVTVSYRVHLS